MLQHPDQTCDVLVIGGGPAGSTAAATLAARGLDVVMLEKDAHPRFHIGESLLPRNLDIFERLGVLERVAAIGVRKPGAEFVSDANGQSVAFPFACSRVRGRDHAFQVRRAEFDQLLFENAAAKGARTLQQARVTGMRGPAADARLRVAAETVEGARTWAPRFVLDASGREAVLASLHGLKTASKLNNTAAVFAHFHNVEARDEATRGYISVHLSQDGWFWIIPLQDGVTSVGFVGTAAAFRQRRGPMEAFFAQRLQASPTVAARMQAAQRIGPVQTAANYSYCARRSWGNRWMMIGDAFAFIDPMFSTGVMMAMTAGELGAETAAAWLSDPARGMALARRGERRLRAAMRRISWLIYRINAPELRTMMMAPSNVLAMRDGVIALLAGNLAEPGRATLPVLAFKATYYGLRGLRRLGFAPVA